MAGEWIKLRAALLNDPKVIAMAEFLADDLDFRKWLCYPTQHGAGDSAFEYVTCDVLRRVTVTSLVTVWCNALDHGVRDNEDCVVRPASLIYIDDVSGVASFGGAMASVGWAEEYEDGSVVFPKLLRDNKLASERKTTSSAERQRRYRANRNAKVTLRNVTGDVTEGVTRNAREDKRREEEKSKTKPPHPPSGGSASEPTIASLPIPDRLATDAFRAAWADWAEYQRQRHRAQRQTPKGAEQALARMARDWNPDRAVAAIRLSIEKGWRSIYEAPRQTAYDAPGSRPAMGVYE